MPRQTFLKSYLAAIVAWLACGCGASRMEVPTSTQIAKDVEVMRSPFGNVTLSDEARENMAFHSALTACLIRHAGFANCHQESVIAEYSTGLLGCGDRERQFGLEPPFLDAYSGNTVRILQQEVLKEFPLWTIILAPA